MAEFTEEEILKIFEMVGSGKPSQFSSAEEMYAYLESVADTGQIVTIDGRTGMIVSGPSKRYGKVYSMVDENGEYIYAYSGLGKPGMNAPDGTYSEWSE